MYMQTLFSDTVHSALLGHFRPSSNQVNKLADSVFDVGEHVKGVCKPILHFKAK